MRDRRMTVLIVLLVIVVAVAAIWLRRERSWRVLVDDRGFTQYVLLALHPDGGHGPSQKLEIDDWFFVYTQERMGWQLQRDPVMTHPAAFSTTFRACDLELFGSSLLPEWLESLAELGHPAVLYGMLPRCGWFACDTTNGGVVEICPEVVTLEDVRRMSPAD